MTTYLPTDSDNNPIPVLRYKSNLAHQISTSTTSVKNTQPFEVATRVVSLYATKDVFLRFGDSSVVATSSDHFLPGGVYYDVALGGEKTGHADYVAVISAGVDGVLYVSERE